MSSIIANVLSIPHLSEYLDASFFLISMPLLLASESLDSMIPLLLFVSITDIQSVFSKTYVDGSQEFPKIGN